MISFTSYQVMEGPQGVQALQGVTGSAERAASALLVPRLLALNSLELPLPGMRVRNLSTFAVEGAKVRVEGEISVVGGAVLSSNTTLMSRDASSDEP